LDLTPSLPAGSVSGQALTYYGLCFLCLLLFSFRLFCVFLG